MEVLYSGKSSLTNLVTSQNHLFYFLQEFIVFPDTAKLNEVILCSLRRDRKISGAQVLTPWQVALTLEAAVGRSLW